MSVNYTSRQRQIIEEIRVIRHNSDPETIVEDALNLLLHEQKLEHLREVISAADERIAKGEVVVMGDNFLAEIKQNSADRRKSGLKPNPDVIP